MLATDLWYLIAPFLDLPSLHSCSTTTSEIQQIVQTSVITSPPDISSSTIDELEFLYTCTVQFDLEWEYVMKIEDKECFIFMVDKLELPMEIEQEQIAQLINQNKFNEYYEVCREKYLGGELYDKFCPIVVEYFKSRSWFRHLQNINHNFNTFILSPTLSTDLFFMELQRNVEAIGANGDAEPYYLLIDQLSRDDSFQYFSFDQERVAKHYEENSYWYIMHDDELFYIMLREKAWCISKKFRDEYLLGVEVSSHKQDCDEYTHLKKYKATNFHLEKFNWDNSTAGHMTFSKRISPPPKQYRKRVKKITNYDG